MTQSDLGDEGVICVQPREEMIQAEMTSCVGAPRGEETPCVWCIMSNEEDIDSEELL